jgi:hypothetical protein
MKPTNQNQHEEKAVRICRTMQNGFCVTSLFPVRTPQEQWEQSLAITAGILKQMEKLSPPATKPETKGGASL